MRGIRSHLLTFAAASVLAVAASIIEPSFVAAQDKKDEQKPSTTVDAWRQSLPPDSEAERPALDPERDAPTRPTREEIEKNLLALELKWMDALKLRDASTLGQILADDFVIVSPRLPGAHGRRDKYLNHALRDLKLVSYEFNDLTVRLYGRAAVVSGRLKQSAATIAGEDLSGDYFITDVWISRDGFWRVVSRHASPLPAAK